MVDFRNPVVIEEDELALTKLWHLVYGIFIWEFFVTLDYEWSVIRGHRKYRWTIWIYSLARLSTLIFVILNLYDFHSSGPVNCKLLALFGFIFAYLGLAGASLLIVLRIIAIWNRNRIAVAIAICAWCTSVAFEIHNIVRPLRAERVSKQSACIVLNTDRSKDQIVAMLVSDVVLLLTMLVGLLRLRKDGTLFGLGKLLWKQGLVWLFLATIAEVPPAVFLILNLSDPLNIMFQPPALIVMTIGATRMHRSLIEFYELEYSTSYLLYSVLMLTVTFFDTLRTRRGREANTASKMRFTTPIPLNRVEVTLHRTFEAYPAAKVGQHVSPYSAESQSQDDPLVLSIGNGQEDGVER